MRLALVLAAALAAAASAAPLLRDIAFRPMTSEARETFFVPRVTAPPNLDGSLDDAAWKSAFSSDRFTVNLGQPAANKTRMWMAFDKDNLYLAFQCAVTPGKLKTTFPKDYNGDGVWGDECLDFKISADGLRHVQQFLVTPAGAYCAIRDSDAKWNAPWKRAARVQGDAYVIELAIPLRTLGVSALQPGLPLLASFNRADRSSGQLPAFSEPYGDMDKAAQFVLGTEQEYRALLDSGVLTRDVAAALYLDRDQYPSFETSATGRVQLRSVQAGGKMKDTAAIVLSLLKDGKEINSQRVSPVKSPKLDFDLPLAGLAPGAYVLEAKVLDGAEVLTSQRREFLVNKAQAVQSGRIALTVPPAPTHLPAWPLTFGVPFAWGALESADNVKLLDSQGREIPIQAKVTARWSRRGSVRWLLIDCILPADTQSRSLALVYGPDVRRAAATDMKVEESKDAVTVTNLPLKLLFPRQNTPGLGEAWLDADGDGAFGPKEKLYVAAKTHGPLMVDEAGVEYYGALFGKPEVVVEDQGPIKTVVRVSGWHASKDGKPLGQFILRYAAYRGLPYVRLHHTFVITESTNKATAGIEKETRYRNIAMGLPVRCMEAYFGTPRVHFARVAGQDAASWMFQRDDLMCKVYKNGKFADECEKSEGWTTAGSPGAFLTVAVKDFWQNFPKEIEAQPDRLNVHFWPRHGEDPIRTGANLSIENSYQMWFAHEGKVLDFKVPDEVLEFVKRDSEHYNYPGAKTSNAIGLAKTHEMLLYFHAADWETARARSTALAFQANLTAMADPAHVCATGVFGQMLPRSPEKFAKVESAIDACIRSIFRDSINDRDYGMFNFGDAHHNWDWQSRRWNLHRIWRNTHHGWTRWPWLQYARSGRKDLFDWADRNARHVADIDHCHYATKEFIGLPWPKGKCVGGICDYKGYVHWNSGNRLCYNSAADAILDHYYFTGDMRSYTTAMEFGGALIADGKAMAHREGSGRVTSAIALYINTWDNDYLDFIDRTINALLATQREDGSFPQWENFAPFLQRYVDLTASRRGMAAMARWSGFDNAGQAIPKLYGSRITPSAHAYLYTGDEKYLRYAATQVEEAVNNVYEGDDPRYQDTFIHGHSNLDQSYFLQEAPYYLMALSRLGHMPRLLEPPTTSIRSHAREKIDGKEWYVFTARLRRDTDAEMTVPLRLSGYKETPFRAELTAVGGGQPVVVEGATPKHTNAIQFDLKIPGGAQREFILRVMSGQNFHTRLPLSDSPDLKEVYPILSGGSWVGGKPGVYFVAPQGAKRVTFEYNGRAWPLKAQIIDPAGKPVDEDVWIGSNTLYSPTRRLTAELGGVREGWMFLVSGYGQAGLMSATFEPQAGRPFYFSFDKAKLFEPSK